MWGHSTTLSQILPLQQPKEIVHDASNKAGASGRAQLVGERVDISRIRGWMKNCASLHGPTCNPPKPSIRESPDLSLLLVDVRRMRLIECGWGSRYVALSYVWGSSPSLNSTNANIHHLQTDGALRELRGELPQAIQDAIELTDALGEKYLWVDALCIIQDDDRSKAVYIARMNQIYGNALVTLVTLNDPLSADSSLSGVSHPRALVQSLVEINGLRLVPRLPQLSTAEQYSAWSRRAWTFQEGILSRRCLYLAEHQVFWQCRTAYQSEDCPDEHDQGASDFARGRKTNALERETGDDVGRQFNVYESLVKQYSPRALTFPTDSLSAFTGVLSAMAELFSWDFASALPEPAFDLALLWRPMFGATMRPRPVPGQEAGPLVCKSPTWCWTAWHGDIFWDPWRLDSFMGRRFRLKTEVESFWIQDSCGSLRPIDRQRGRAHDSDGEMIAGSKPGEDTTLVFEARTIDIEAYDISAPQIDRCVLWDSSMAGGGLSSYFRNNASHSLWIYDAAGHHCGTFSSLDAAWPDQHRRKDSPRHDILLLSRSHQDEVTQSSILHFQNHLPLEYPSAKEYYEEIFDTRYYGFVKDWALNLMLVGWGGDGLTAERVAVGQMHADAWRGDVQREKMIILV